jgi:exodeoxyribonuclease I
MGDQKTFYWHDYETFGIDPMRDRPVQFAGIRTDFDLNIVDDPLVVYCRPSADSLPQPEACLITGIAPQFAEEKGVCEAEFIRLIHQQIAQANTCTVGYNNIRFDDEVTRVCLYRNFYDPYAREWQNGNSRWDLMDVVRAARALRPDGIVWPVNDEGRPSLKLEDLTQANGIEHSAAHDALSDVYATLAIAKLIRKAQPKLYQFLLDNRLKAEVIKLLDLGSFKPVVHISGKYSALKNNMAIALPVCKHPGNKNGVIVYDLSIDPEPLLNLTVEEVQQRIFTANEDLPEGADRIPLKTIHINKCPVIAPISVISADDERRLELDISACRLNIQKIKAVAGLAKKLAAVFSHKYAEQASDPDLQIYSGGFFSDTDKQKMASITLTPPDQLGDLAMNFSDDRLPEMLFRYRARNYPDTLRSDELKRWNEFCCNRLTGRADGGSITLAAYLARLQDLSNVDDANKAMLSALEAYAFEKMQRFGIQEIQ